MSLEAGWLRCCSHCALVCQRTQPVLVVAIEPLVSRLAADPERLADRSEALLGVSTRQDETNSLFHRTGLPPRHRNHLRQRSFCDLSPLGMERSVTYRDGPHHHTARAYVAVPAARSSAPRQRGGAPGTGDATESRTPTSPVATLMTRRVFAVAPNGAPVHKISARETTSDARESPERAK